MLLERERNAHTHTHSRMPPLLLTVAVRAGHGDFPATNNPERTMSIIIMAVGGSAFTYAVTILCVDIICCCHPPPFNPSFKPPSTRSCCCCVYHPPFVALTLLKPAVASRWPKLTPTRPFSKSGCVLRWCVPTAYCHEVDSCPTCCLPLQMDRLKAWARKRSLPRTSAPLRSCPAEFACVLS